MALLALTACGSEECLAGSTKCGSTCVELVADNLNCGACGNACDAGEVCSAGACALSCQAGLDDCSGSCRDLQTDRGHCGACGNACDAGEVCSAGTCTVSCQAGLTNCSGACVDTGTSEAHCGGCGTACGTGFACVAATCARIAMPCATHPQWTPVTCTTASWVWSRERVVATTVATADLNHVLATGCTHGLPQPGLGEGMCSLTGAGWVSTQTFTMSGCDTSWYHLGGSYTGNCGGHDGDTWRHLVMDPNGCFSY